MLPATPFERTTRCRGGKKRPRTLLFVVLYLPPKPSGRGEATPWRKTLDAVYRWTDGLLVSLPTRCMPVLMLDCNDRLGRPRAEEPHDLIGTVGAGVEGDSATHVSEPLKVDTQLLCHKRFTWLHPHFMVRADDHESILLPHPFCAILAHLCQFHGWKTVTVDTCCGPS